MEALRYCRCRSSMAMASVVRRCRGRVSASELRSTWHWRIPVFTSLFNAFMSSEQFCDFKAADVLNFKLYWVSKKRICSPAIYDFYVHSCYAHDGTNSPDASINIIDSNGYDFRTTVQNAARGIQNSSDVPFDWVVQWTCPLSQPIPSTTVRNMSTSICKHSLQGILWK